jgi:hypothetical protein
MARGYHSSLRPLAIGNGIGDRASLSEAVGTCQRNASCQPETKEI